MSSCVGITQTFASTKLRENPIGFSEGSLKKQLLIAIVVQRFFVG